MSETVIADTGPVDPPEKRCPATTNPCQTPVYCAPGCWKEKPAVPRAETATSTRAGSILRAAAAIVEGKRSSGRPERALKTIASYWTAYIEMLDGAPLGPVQVADMMVLMKLARAQHGVSPIDSAKDMAGYAALAGEARAAEAARGASEPGDEVPV